MHEEASRPSGPERISASPRNSEARRDELQAKAPAPPAGGWSAWYLTDEDDVGESTDHFITIRLLLAALIELARERGWTDRLVAGDQFFGWVPTHPLVRISPDVYILDNPPAPYPKSFQTWLAGHAAPRFAVEVVSDDWTKDYDDNPPKYDQLGTRELVLFDPDAAHRPRGRRVALQVFRRDAAGALVCVASGPGPVHSAELDAWLVVGPDARLHIARDAAGTDLVKPAEVQLPELEARFHAQEARFHAQEARFHAQEAQLRELQAQLRDRDAKLQAQADRIRELEARPRGE
jgi:hypothetical protein